MLSARRPSLPSHNYEQSLRLDSSTMVTRHRDTGKGRAEAESSTQENASLPLAVDAAMSLSPEELAVLQEQYLIEQDKGFVSTQTKFNLAWWVTRLLIREARDATLRAVADINAAVHRHLFLSASSIWWLNAGL